MVRRGNVSRLALALAGAGLVAMVGCAAAISGETGDGSAGRSGTAGRPGIGGNGGAGATQGAGGVAIGGGGNGAGGNGGVGVASAYLPPRVRRLSNAEYDATV